MWDLNQFRFNAGEGIRTIKVLTELEKVQKIVKLSGIWNSNEYKIATLLI
jgi:hypothetical protein